MLTHLLIASITHAFTQFLHYYLRKGLSSSKHSGVRSLFHQNFVKSGIIDIELGRFFDKLFDNRQKADYSDLLRVNIDEVHHWYDETKEFVAKIEDILQKL